MTKLMEWLKPKLVWIISGAAAVVAAFVAIATLMRSKKPRVRSTIPRPELEDPKEVVVPEVKTDFNDRPADDYKDKKVVPSTDKSKVIDDLNNDL